MKNMKNNKLRCVSILVLAHVLTAIQAEVTCPDIAGNRSTHEVGPCVKTSLTLLIKSHRF